MPRHPHITLVTRFSLPLLASILIACGGESGTTPSGSASSNVRGGLTPNSLKTASGQPTASTPAPAATPSGPVELSKVGCPEAEPKKRVCTAAVFQKTWKPSKDPSVFPSSASYKVTGTITKIEQTDKSKGETGESWVFMKGDDADVGFKFAADSKDLEAVSKLKVGAEATFTCKFGGLEEIGKVTLDNCAL